MKKFLLSIFTLLCVLATANAESYTHTFSEGELTTTGGSVTLSDAIWNATTATVTDWNGQGKGIQIGGKNDCTTSYTLSTAAFSDYTITSIKVYSCIASSGDAKLTIKAGGATSEEFALTTTNTAYTFECKEQGDITISWAATQRAYYVSKIEIEYELPASMVDVEEPTFKTPEGVYENKVTVTAETADQSLVLYYTLDGTEPSYEDFENETGTTKCSKYYVMYPELQESATIKVIAVKVDGESIYKSDVVEAHYIVSQTKPFVPATGIKTGCSYAFVANDSVADFLFGAVNGNMQSRKISGKYDKYIETVAYSAFTFTSTNGGYTIQDAEERYMYLGNNGEVAFATELPTEGTVWSVSIENEQATIKNGNSTLYYSIANDIFGCYANKTEDMVLPAVYLVREYPKASITPEDGSYVKGLKEFTITCEEGIAVSSDFSLKAQSGQKEDRTYEIDKTYKCTQVDANTLKFTIDEELVSVDNINIDLIITGDIYLNPEGMNYKHPIKGRWTRSIYSYTHEGNAPAATIVSVEPANGTKVEALSYILFTFSNIATTVDTSKEAKLYREGSTENTPMAFTNYKEDGVNYVAQNQGGLQLETPVTKNGTYILEIPDGYFVDRNSKEIKGITLKYTVENETAIHDIIAEGENGWVIYSTSGIKVMETKDANKVKALPSGIYIVNGIKTVIK